MLQRAFLITGLFVGLSVASVALAAPGTITTKDGTVYVGDVKEAGDKVIVTDNTGSGIEIDQSNVSKLTYFKTIEEEYRFQLARLDAHDVKGRLALAAWGRLKQDQPGLAREATTSALRIDPANAEAKKMLEVIAAVEKAKQPPAKPATEPAGSQPVKGAHAGPPRLVTKPEVNRIRQIEWQPSDQGVRVQVDKEVKASFIAGSRSITPQEFNKMSPAQQAAEILRTGTPKMRAGVHILSDPTSMLNYRRNVQKVLVSGCATTGCHEPAANKDFVLYTETTDEAVYTNFLILQNYRTTVAGTERLMIDRNHPGDSLLTQYTLVPKVAETPHPKAEAYAGIFKTAADPRYKLIAQWLMSLPPIEKEYGIDLSKPPIEEKEPAAAPEEEKPR